MKQSGMVILPQTQYRKIADMLLTVPFNTLFAKAVLESKADGIVWGNHEENPTAFLIVHRYGMSLLFGDTEDENFNQALQRYLLNSDYLRNTSEWMQVYPDSWNGYLRAWLGNSFSSDYLAIDPVSVQPLPHCEEIRINTPCHLWDRVNFTFHGALPTLQNSKNFTIERINADLYKRIQGTVIPPLFWKSMDDFLTNGIGFALLQDGNVVSIAFSSCVDQAILEIGVETAEAYRGHGYARLVCQKMIHYCLLHHYQPIWACKRENVGSYRLATSLGFTEQCNQPYYELPYIQESPYHITSDSTKIRPEDVRSLLQQSYWANERKVEIICNSIKHSLCYGIFCNDELVGFGRVVTDYSTMFWICDIIIDQKHRGKQLGKWLIATITKTKELNGLYGILATKDAHGLYEQYGFNKESSKFMVKLRPQ